MNQKIGFVVNAANVLRMTQVIDTVADKALYALALKWRCASTEVPCSCLPNPDVRLRFWR